MHLPRKPGVAMLTWGFAAVMWVEVKGESKCDVAPRPPPPGCCPLKYAELCLATVPLCEGRPKVGNASASFSSSFAAAPSAKHPCGRPWKSEACQGGFYLDTTDPLKPSVKPCPPGFFCPELQTVIVPCPLGAYCSQLKRQELPQPKNSSKICENVGICCFSDYLKDVTPLLMENSGKFICPGMSTPDPCPEGFYCPNTTTKLSCTRGHYCQQGSIQPKKCPLLTKCGIGESAPLKNAAGPLLAVIIVVIFFAAYYSFKYRRWLCNELPQRLGIRKKPASFGLSFNVKKGLKGIMINMVNLSEEEKRERIQPRSFTMDIRFQDLSLTLAANGRKVLSGVTGTIRSGEVTAVLGPSGAGKTTFLNALSDKAYYGTVGGTIWINGEEVKDIKKYRRITGFVPQEDTMHRQLTVKEVLEYQARLRLPSSTDKQKIHKIVEQTLELLDIAHVKDSQIGDEETRGISGGQRKRVNIGMELVADPTLLFLDEPTSGLDSTSSLSVLGALRAVAERGRLTVICVIHQPRYEIFSLFHNVLLLGPGGRTVYQGTVREAESYFGSLGYSCPEKVNPADYYMDVIGGVYKTDEEDFVDGLFNSWQKKESEDQVDASNDITLSCSNDQFVARSMPNVAQQFWTFLVREVHLQFRYIKSLFMDLILVLVAGGVLGGLYAEVKLEKVIAMNTFSSLAIGLTAMLSSLRCFGNHRTTFWRESASGVNTFSYFLAVNVCQLPIILLTPLIYLSLQYTFTAPRALFVYHYVATLMTQFACTGMGYAISCILNPRNSQMASVVIVLISSLLSGSVPSLCQLNKFTFVGPLAYNLSYSRWFVEALFEKEVERYPVVLRSLIDGIAYGNDYSLSNFAFCLAILFIFGLVFRLIAYLFLVFTNRGKQQ